MDEPSDVGRDDSPAVPEPVRPLNPLKKKWLLLQLLGGFVAVIGILIATYSMGKAAHARIAVRVPKEAALIAVGVAIHVAGRIGVRRLDD